MLAAAAQYVDVPGYNALILRRTFADLSKPGALIPLSMEWWGSRNDVKYDSALHQWQFPSGATISFGYLDSKNDIYQYQGAAFQFIGFDELTQFYEPWYLYLFSRKRRRIELGIPTRVRSASNPGGLGHEWVRQRFLIDGRKFGRVFVPAKLTDNPHLDQEDYQRSLENLDPITRAQLLNGDWNVIPDGELFKREYFQIVDDYPMHSKIVRFWDFAATRNTTSAFTAGAKLATHQGQYWLLDMVRFRGDPLAVENTVRLAAELDGTNTPVYIEQEPGSGGINTISHYQRNILRGYNVNPYRPDRDKVSRAGPLSSAARAGNLFLVRGNWINTWLEEALAFPHAFKDQIDATSGAFTVLNLAPRPNIRSLR
jgi:predicted phage terminase large subunit-like protein